MMPRRRERAHARRLPGLLLAALGVLAASPAAQAGSAAVTFPTPDRYADGNLAWSPTDQRLTFEGLSRIFGRLAERRLPDGYRLDVEVVALDLAGKIDPLRSRTGQLRVMRADTWPSATLRFTLRRGGKVVARGEDAIAYVDYLSDPLAVRSGEPLRFEKAMLDRWMRTRFASLRPAES